MLYSTVSHISFHDSVQGMPWTVSSKVGFLGHILLIAVHKCLPFSHILFNTLDYITLFIFAILGVEWHLSLVFPWIMGVIISWNFLSHWVPLSNMFCLLNNSLILITPWVDFRLSSWEITVTYLNIIHSLKQGEFLQRRKYVKQVIQTFPVTCPLR